MGNRDFYKSLEPLPSFAEASDGSRHSSLPADWWVVVADVAGSTAAIEAGRYKDVNTVAAAMIMSVINVDRSSEIPFVFGGDGATLAIPPHMVDGATIALRASKKLALEGFNLDLRVGLFPASDILKRDLRLGVCKYKHSSKINQSSFSGFGWSWAETTLKDPKANAQYLVSADGVADADFSGFECRWSPVNARKDFKLALIVLSTAQTLEGHSSVYAEVIQEIEKIYGANADYHPLREKGLSLTTSLARLRGEAIVKAKQRHNFSYFIGSLTLAFISLVGMLAFNFNLKLLGVRWGKYRKEVVENADFRKFDGSLKMIIDSSAVEEKRLRAYLDHCMEDRKLVYGLHESKAAIMTCLIFTPGQDHAHFVDGSDGGYAMAAKVLKKNLSDYKSWRSSQL